MEFCPTCGCFLSPKRTRDGTVLSCYKCGYIKQAADKKDELKVTKVFQPKVQETLTVITEEDQKISTMQTIKMKCEKCGNNEVYVWQVQTRGGDEASTQFMRCTKCGHTFREYA
ncbi:MAG: transcription factor S [Candidatus Bathyarchaeota archaeon]|nr:transcription factor S [Candidatus Bathyarchaeota archaeon]